jgi:hypothetical protein
LGFFAVPLTLGGAGIGFVASLFLLWTTDLSRSTPMVFIVTVVVAALAGRADPLVAIGAALVCAILTMVWCRTRFAFDASRPRVA